MILKEQIEMILRDNAILKRAVAIQHERQKEYDVRNEEAQHLKRLIVQYQEELRTLEVKAGSSYINFLALTHSTWRCVSFTTIARHQILILFTPVFVSLMQVCLQCMRIA